MDDDDDEDMGSPPLENSMPRETSLPPHMQNQSYMRHTTASPPPSQLHNGHPMYQRQGTPQAHMISRPGSSNAVRRSSTNLGPSSLQQVSQPPQAANGYTYARPQGIPYNAPAPQGMPVGPHHPQQPQSQPQYYTQLTQAGNPQVQQTFMQDQRRQSLGPPPFPHQQEQHHPHASSPPRGEKDQNIPDDQRMPKPAPSKSRSIFTPVEEGSSVLARAWGSSKPTQPKQPEIKHERDERPSSTDPNQAPSKESSKTTSPPTQIQDRTPVPRRSTSTEFPPPSRVDSQSGAKRPRLKVQIPEEQSDAEASESSPRHSGNTPAKATGSTEASHSSGTGVVLPPPSPSASANALLSAGAQGPPNPFARPAPPPMGSQQRSDSIETPISALPSRFVADGLLPSPSSFYPEWGFGRSGGESANILPSPLTFQTPIANGPSFSRDDDADKKRKSPDNQTPQEETMKRVKT